MTTKPVEGASELGNQMARLMDTLTRAGQGNSLGSTPNSPRHRGCRRGRTDRTTSSSPISHNGKTGLGQTTLAHSTSAGHRNGTTGQGQGNAQGPRDGQGNTSNKKDPSSLQCFQCQGWGHMAQQCATLAKSLNQNRGNQGNVVQPPTSSSQQ